MPITKPKPKELQSNPAKPERTLKEVVLSGGGTNTLAILGSLHVLYEKKKLQKAIRWVGSSAGALLCLTAVLGYSPESIFRLLMHIDYEKLNDANCDSMLSFYDTMGVLDGTRFVQLVERIVVKKGFHSNITFCELAARTGKELVVAGYNLTRGRTEVFDACHTPHMSVLLACRISISVPFLFRPVQFNESLYIDGCTVEHVPVRFRKYTEEAIIIQCVKQKPNSLEDGSAPPPTDIPSFFALLQRRIGTQLHRRCMRRVLKSNPQSVISICISQAHSTSFVVDFNLTTERKRQLFLLGTEATQKHLSEI